MPYQGNAPAEAYTTTTKDSFSGDGSTTAFTMSKPSTTNNVRVVVENVIQNPTTAYTCSGTTLTFTSAPPTGTNNIYVMHLGPAAMKTTLDESITVSELTVSGKITGQAASEIEADLTLSGGQLTVEHTGDFMTATRFAASSLGPAAFIQKSRGATVGTNTIVQSGDTLGGFVFQGANGTDYNNAASIFAHVDGTPGASSDMPGRLTFHTTPDGSSTEAEAMRISNGGQITMPKQPAFLAKLSADDTGFNAGGDFGATVGWDQTEYNVGNNFSTSTGLFTAPKDGIYLFHWSHYCNAAIDQAWLVVNGSRANFTDFIGGAAGVIMNGAVMLKLSYNDTVGTHPYDAGNTNLTILDSNNHTWFKGWLLG